MTEAKIANGGHSDGHHVLVMQEATVTLPIIKNRHLHRESQGCASLLFYSLIFVGLDVLNQSSLYGMKYLNRNVYPVPQTCIVFMTEVFKFFTFVVIILWTKGYSALCSVSPSLGYAIPSLCYAINNNIFLYALRFTTPPVWNVLAQSRLILTALTYHFVFKRAMSAAQWFGIALILVGVILLNVSGLHGLISRHQTLPSLFYLVVLSSVIAVIGNFTMEYMFKNDLQKVFSEMQLLIYGYGAMATGFLCGLEWFTDDEEWSPNVKGDPQLIGFLVCSTLVLGCASGVAVAFIIKKLDNIVKIYTQSLSNIFTSVACTVFFPNHFHLTWMFLVCMVLITVAITIYESHQVGSLADIIESVREAFEFIQRGPPRSKRRRFLSEASQPLDPGQDRRRTTSMTEP